MEASALPAPAPIARLPVAPGLLRLRSDEQLVALLRRGNDEAFRVLHDRYRQRLFGYVRQMLSGASRQDAEDVLQDVFVRAYGALRADERAVHVRAWLYRIAHNRCIDHLRRPVPAPGDIRDAWPSPLRDPLVEAERREDLRRLVADVGRLPPQQRSALVMREIDGLSYQDLAGALDVTVPAVKSLLVRARVGLVEAAEARDADCHDIRRDLLCSYDRGIKASGRARRHLRECPGCREYRTALRGVRRSFAALAPGAGIGPLALLAQAAGLGGAGGGAAASAGGGAATVLAGATACKVAAVVCTAAITAGGAAEVKRLAHRPPAAAPRAAVAGSAPPPAPANADAVAWRPASPRPRAITAPAGAPVARRPQTPPPRRSARPVAERHPATVTVPPAGEAADAEPGPIVIDPPAAAPPAPAPATGPDAAAPPDGAPDPQASPAPPPAAPADDATGSPGAPEPAPATAPERAPAPPAAAAAGATPVPPDAAREEDGGRR